ncbi:hypothetical protein [Lentzea nigeriaca]|uniref:hypothetical protein n=1 Tax=Lentzea nigeriaca TaxID=1128665 RepID=UPI00195C12C3|nr:hypothetical protein [Lentzea nigeriaca]MBM7863061.1 hypothetical protein [Lentzea nigeriaca]
MFSTRLKAGTVVAATILGGLAPAHAEPRILACGDRTSYPRAMATCAARWADPPNP